MSIPSPWSNEARVVRPLPDAVLTRGADGPEHGSAAPRVLRASWELCLPPYDTMHALERAMELCMRQLPEAHV